MRIDPQEFERLKKALLIASEKSKEAEAVVRAAEEGYASAKNAHSKAYMELREYFSKCAGFEGWPF